MNADMGKTHGKPTSVATCGDSNDELVMAAHGISRDGYRYAYKGYRYDRLADAVAYADLVRSRPLGPEEAAGSFVRHEPPQALTTVDRELMASLAIGFNAGVYEFAGFRYDRLADAVNYARLSAQRREADSDASPIVSRAP